MSNYIVHVHKHIEHRTPSGRWSKVEYDPEDYDLHRDEFERSTSTEWQRSFNARVSRKYTKWGYLPCRWVAVGPFMDTRYVYDYSFEEA